MITNAYRLTQGQDLKNAIATHFGLLDGQDAGVLLSCVGSLSAACIRLAGADKVLNLQGPFEILSLNGTLSTDGLHLHICLADRDGHTIGGHLMEGNIVYTTAEVVIGLLPNYRFSREHDPKTGFKELEINKK